MNVWDMSFQKIVLKAKHRRQVRMTNKGFRAHQAKLARIRAEEDVSLEEFRERMKNERGCI